MPVSSTLKPLGLTYAELLFRNLADDLLSLRMIARITAFTHDVPHVMNPAAPHVDLESRAYNSQFLQPRPRQYIMRR